MLHFFLSKILMNFLLVIASFFAIFCPSVTLCTPCIHTRMLFSRFCTLLCALVTVNRPYRIHHLFFLNSSLHKQPFITAHFRSSLHMLCITAQCTLKQALDRTISINPASFHLNKKRVSSNRPTRV